MMSDKNHNTETTPTEHYENSCANCGYFWVSTKTNPTLCPRCHSNLWSWCSDKSLRYAPVNVILSIIKPHVVSRLGNQNIKIFDMNLIDVDLREKLPTWREIHRTKRSKAIRDCMLMIDPTLFKFPYGNQRVFYRR